MLIRRVQFVYNLLEPTGSKKNRTVRGTEKGMDKNLKPTPWKVLLTGKIKLIILT